MHWNRWLFLNAIWGLASLLSWVLGFSTARDVLTQILTTAAISFVYEYIIVPGVFCVAPHDHDQDSGIHA